jgi:hypothetical protein
MDCSFKVETYNGPAYVHGLFTSIRTGWKISALNKLKRKIVLRVHGSRSSYILHLCRLCFGAGTPHCPSMELLNINIAYCR